MWYLLGFTLGFIVYCIGFRAGRLSGLRFANRELYKLLDERKEL